MQCQGALLSHALVPALGQFDHVDLLCCRLYTVGSMLDALKRLHVSFSSMVNLIVEQLYQPVRIQLWPGDPTIEACTVPLQLKVLVLFLLCLHLLALS